MRKCSRELGSAVESYEVQSRVWKCSREHGSAVEGVEVQSKAWKCNREKKCSRVMKNKTFSTEKKHHFLFAMDVFLG